MKIDPYKNKEKYFRWKNSVKDKLPGISKANSKLLLDYMFDMEQGLNVGNSSKKGARSYIRLNNLKNRLLFLMKNFEERYNLKDATKITERELHDFFTGMRNGTVRRLDGQIYKSPTDYVKIFKAFWHWHQKVNRKKGIEILDVTIDLDISQTKPAWVYLDENQVKKLCDNANYNYKVLMMFLFDTGIRAPTELTNIRVSDFYNGFKELNIRDEVSKTFGRRIKLMLSSELIKEYVIDKQLKDDDRLFTTSPALMNRYIKSLAKRILGEEKSPGGEKYSRLTI